LARAWIIAKNTLLEIRQRRLAYLVGVLSILTVASVWVSLSWLERAQQAGEVDLANRMPRTIITQTIDFWNIAIELIVLYLGVTVLSAEIKSRAIVPTLARPVSRHEFLAGKILGVVLVAVALFAIPLALSLLAAWWFTVDLSLVFWLGLLQALVAYIATAVIAVALAAVSSPMTAGLIVIFGMPLARDLGAWLTKLDQPLWATVGFLLYCFAPATSPHELIHHSFDSSLIDPAYGVTTLVMLENLGFAVLLFALAAWAFDRREIHADG